LVGVVEEMSDKILIIIALVTGLVLGLVAPYIYSIGVTAPIPDLTSTCMDDYTCMPHYVKFHIHPEMEGVNVVAWASDKLPITSGITDNKSELVLQLLPTTNYHLLIGGNKCSYYITPTESEYEVVCDVR